MGELAEVGDCPLAHGDAVGLCSWCGAALKGRRKRWCRDECRDAMLANHYWAWARPAAVERDGGTCVRCGANPQQLRASGAEWLELLDFLTGRPPFVGMTAWAEAQGMTLPQAIEHRARFHAEQMAQQQPWYDARKAWGEWLVGFSLEVNHMEPILGRHAEKGCHHHLDGLETLCHACHVTETARQFGHRSRRAASGAARLPL